MQKIQAIDCHPRL
jgi:hypothetical protein